MNSAPRSFLAPLMRAFPLATVLAIAAAIAVESDATPPAPVASLGTPARIMIDPGHGDTDPGAVGNGLLEKDLNLAVGLRLRELLEEDTLDPAGGGEWEVYMTRDTDVFVSLQGRVDLANNLPVDRFVSIHHNAFSSSTANGTETFSFANGTVSADLRDLVQEELLLGLGLTDRGAKTANFFVLRETSMPAVLSEGGFVSNPGDAAVFSDPQAIEDSARAHLFALQRHYGQAAYLPNVQQDSDPTPYCTAKVDSAGCVPSVGATGTASLASSDLVVYCDQVLSQQFGLLFWGGEELQLPLLGGTLCVGGSLVRTPVQFSNGLGFGNCSGRLELAFDSAYLQTSGLAPGDDVFVQWWYRDPGALPATPVGLSNGLRFTVRP